jgi:torulene dioxygenase
MSFPSLDEFFTQTNFVAGFQKNNKHRNATEVPDPIWLDIQGEIPSWLNGVLYRIGKISNPLSHISIILTR